MPEEATEAPDESGNAASSEEHTQAPPGGDTPQEIDWQKRYNDLRPEYDREKQKWSAYESDPESFLRDLGLLAEDEQETEFEPGEFDADYDPTETRLSALEQHLEAQALEAQQAELEEATVDFINDGLGELESEHGRTFTQQEADALGDLSRIRTDEQGLPDVKGAYELLYSGVLSAERDRWVQQKNAPQVPTGRSGQSAPDLDNPQERREYMAARLAQVQSDA